jgi:hypothetical protein
MDHNPVDVPSQCQPQEQKGNPLQEHKEERITASLNGSTANGKKEKMECEQQIHRRNQNRLVVCPI